MATKGGICSTCQFFRSDVHPGKDKPNHCALQDVPLSATESQKHCPECIPAK